MDLNELYKQLDQRPPGFTEFDKDTEGNPIVYPGERFCRVKVGEGLCPNTRAFSSATNLRKHVNEHTHLKENNRKAIAPKGSNGQSGNGRPSQKAWDQSAVVIGRLMKGAQLQAAAKTLSASSGTAFLIGKDQTISVTNTHGRQVVDFWAINPSNPAEYLSMSHNHAIHRKVHFKVGDTLYSSISRPILTWVDDTSIGDHDTLISACNPMRYEKMGVKGWHASCAENYQQAIERLSAPVVTQDVKDRLPITPPTPLNLFMNVKVNGEGGIVFRAPTSKKGDYVALKALMDVIIVLSACPMDQRASEDWLPDPKEVHYAVMEH